MNVKDQLFSDVMNKDSPAEIICPAGYRDNSCKKSRDGSFCAKLMSVKKEYRISEENAIPFSDLFCLG